MGGWANCSPVVVGSVERRGVIRTAGSTLVAAASPGTPLGGDCNTRRILHEIREKDKQEQEELLREVKKHKVTKRCLAKEVDEQVRGKLGLAEKPASKKRKKENDKMEDGPDQDKQEKIKKPKTTANKKEKPLMKGQMKLTSFFKV